MCFSLQSVVGGFWYPQTLGGICILFTIRIAFPPLVPHNYLTEPHSQTIDGLPNPKNTTASFAPTYGVSFQKTECKSTHPDDRVIPEGNIVILHELSNPTRCYLLVYHSSTLNKSSDYITTTTANLHSLFTSLTTTI